MKQDNPFAKLGALDQKLYQDRATTPQAPLTESSGKLVSHQTVEKKAEVNKDSPNKKIQANIDTSLLTTKEKTKYGTYITDETIEKIRIRAIQLKRDDHQIVQLALNKYFEK